MLTSLSNKRVKYLNKLRNKKYILENKEYIVEGYNLVEEAIKSGVAKEIILLEGTVYDTSLPITYVTYEILKKISRLEHTPNIMAVCKVEEKEKKISDKIIILDNVSDPGNIGTIIRTALAFNIDTIVLSNDSVSIYNDKLIRASEGAIFKANVITRDLKEFIKEIKNDGYAVIGTALKNSESIKTLKKCNKYALVFGNEGNGIKEEILELCNKRVKIDISSKVESLNVSIASGIMMFYMEE